MTSSPTLPARRLRWVWAHEKGTTPMGFRSHRGCGGLEFDTQGSRGGNPGLEVTTASRYLIKGS